MYICYYLIVIVQYLLISVDILGEPKLTPPFPRLTLRYCLRASTIGLRFVNGLSVSGAVNIFSRLKTITVGIDSSGSGTLYIRPSADMLSETFHTVQKRLGHIFLYFFLYTFFLGGTLIPLWNGTVIPL